MERLFWIIQVDPIYSYESLRVKNLPRLWSEGECNYGRKVREMQHSWFWSGERGSQVKECGKPLEAGKARTDSSLEPPEETSPADTLTLAQGAGFWTSDLWNCKIISLYHFKPQSAWWFVIATRENITWVTCILSLMVSDPKSPPGWISLQEE